ncbi:DUF2339 domain-containing protein [Mycobacterium sp. SMC-4]|uniref:DUF2339 domain-containing protein n=1 Tax=Mycobacterium sp. SMC-4 TaxID=2857059 RepID=UPI003D03BEE0
MTEPHSVVISRLSADFAAISRQLAQASADLRQLDAVLSHRMPVGPPIPVVPPQPAVVAPQPVAPRPVAPTGPYGHYPPPPTPAPPPAARPPLRREPAASWIGKLLAVAGVGVTLIGVVLLLVLAAQAGVLRPEFRVAGGAVLAVGLVAAGQWLFRRPGGRVGAIALVATGVAAAYIDVIALTTIYDWVSAAVGLTIAALIAGGGLMLARRWDSEQLGLLVVVPLLVLAPVVTDGITLLLIGFMLALAAMSVPVQLGRDWIWLHSARTAAVVLPLLTALAVRHFDSRHDLTLAVTCALGAVLAIVAALVLLPGTANRAVMALLAAAGVTPLLCVGLAVDDVVAALMVAALSAALLAVVLLADHLPGVPGVPRQVFTVVSAVAALFAVVTAFDGTVAGPMLLAIALTIAVVVRDDEVARWVALGFTVMGGSAYVVTAKLSALLTPTSFDAATGVSILVSSLLLGAVAIAWTRTVQENSAVLWSVAAVIVVYAVTQFSVTAATLVAPGDRGFYAGHMIATICWIAMAAAAFRYAVRLDKAARSVPISGGLGLVGAAVAKLFLFDLSALDGIFRVAVFLVVGLVLLAMGAGYARLLDRQDELAVTNDTG